MDQWFQRLKQLLQACQQSDIFSQGAQNMTQELVLDKLPQVCIAGNQVLLPIGNKSR
jgi:hypothetical protein